MTTDTFVKLLADKSGIIRWDVYKVLNTLGDLIKEEVFEKGEDVAIGGLGHFKQVVMKDENDNEFKVLSFKPVPSMNNDSWHEQFKY